MCVCVCLRGISPLFIWPCILEISQLSRFFCHWNLLQFTSSEIRGYKDLLLIITTWQLHYWYTSSQSHIWWLNQIPLILPPANGCACRSCQGDFWGKFKLISSQMEPKEDNLHIHGKTEQCWLNLTRVTFIESCSWFQLISVKWCPYIDRRGHE